MKAQVPTGVIAGCHPRIASTKSTNPLLLVCDIFVKALLQYLSPALSCCSHYTLQNVSNSQIEPFDARDSNAHAIPKLESAMTLRNKTLHSTAAYGSTDYGPSTIDTQAYQTSPRKLGRRKGGHFTTGTALCCMNTADVIDGAGESSGLRTTDGPGMAFWVGVGMAILFQVSVIVALA